MEAAHGRASVASLKTEKHKHFGYEQMKGLRAGQKQATGTRTTQDNPFDKSH